MACHNNIYNYYWRGVVQYAEAVLPKAIQHASHRSIHVPGIAHVKMILLNHYVLTGQPRRALHRLLCRHSRWVVSHAGHTVRPPTVQDTGCGQPFVMWCGDIENV